MGGNIVTNSDLLPVLKCMGATLYFNSAQGERVMKFTSNGYALKTGKQSFVHHVVNSVMISRMLRSNEVLTTVFIPLSDKVRKFIDLKLDQEAIIFSLTVVERIYL